MFGMIADIVVALWIVALWAVAIGFLGLIVAALVFLIRTLIDWAWDRITSAL